MIVEAVILELPTKYEEVSARAGHSQAIFTLHSALLNALMMSVKHSVVCQNMIKASDGYQVCLNSSCPFPMVVCEIWFSMFLFSSVLNNSWTIMFFIRNISLYIMFYELLNGKHFTFTTSRTFNQLILFISGFCYCFSFCDRLFRDIFFVYSLFWLYSPICLSILVLQVFLSRPYSFSLEVFNLGFSWVVNLFPFSLYIHSI